MLTAFHTPHQQGPPKHGDRDDQLSAAAISLLNFASSAASQAASSGAASRASLKPVQLEDGSMT